MWFRETSSAAAERALDGLALRLEAVADNIANAETPGHRPVKVQFEDALSQAIAQERTGTDTTSAAQVDSVLPGIARRPVPAGQPVTVRLEEEMTDLARTVAHYDTVARAAAKQYRMLRTAITGSGG